MKFQYFGPLTQRPNSLEKTLILGNIDGKRRRRRQKMKWLNRITNSIDLSLSKYWEIGTLSERQRRLACWSSWGQKVGHNLTTEQGFGYLGKPFYVYFCKGVFGCKYHLKPGGSADRESACNTWDLGSIPGLERSPGEGDSYPLQHSGLENSMDCIAHGVPESDITEWLSLSFKSVNFEESRLFLYPHYGASLLTQ